MSRGTKKLLLAIFASALAFLVGIYVYGIAKPFAITSRGPISREDLTDSLTLKSFMEDPTFREYNAWGSFSVESHTAAIVLFVLLPILTFIFTLIFSFTAKNSNQSNSKNRPVAGSASTDHQQPIRKKRNSVRIKRYLAISVVWILWVSLRTATDFELLGYYFHEWDNDMFYINAILVPVAMLIFGIWQKNKE